MMVRSFLWSFKVFFLIPWRRATRICAVVQVRIGCAKFLNLDTSIFAQKILRYLITEFCRLNNTKISLWKNWHPKDKRTVLDFRLERINAILHNFFHKFALHEKYSYLYLFIVNYVEWKQWARSLKFAILLNSLAHELFF